MAPGAREALARLGLGLLNNGASLEELLRRPEIGLDDLLFLDDALAALPVEVRDELETTVKYEGYIRRQQDQVERTRRMEEQAIPAGFDYAAVVGASPPRCARSCRRSGRAPSARPAASPA